MPRQSRNQKTQALRSASVPLFTRLSRSKTPTSQFDEGSYCNLTEGTACWFARSIAADQVTIAVFVPSPLPAGRPLSPSET